MVFRPLKIVLPVPGQLSSNVLYQQSYICSPGAELIVLSFSGLDQSEACWVTRLMRAIGKLSYISAINVIQVGCPLLQGHM